ncbi:hypothetical protein [Actinoplanes sp. NPDC049681]|uniref:hypothetical protein n=1 Tax=Actinoplanes sp. NPDC049681 TaxID=3363905 RepID=UPI00378A0B4B
MTSASWSLQSRRPSFFFVLDLIYLCTLLLFALSRVYGWPWFVSDLPTVISSVLPIGVPWFGALGAVTISLYGVFSHNSKWENTWCYWHVARPVVGMILGTIAYFILFGVLQATSGRPTGDMGLCKADCTDPHQQGQLVVFYVLAFVVGFREATFRRLVTRATDLMLGADGSTSNNAEGDGLTTIVNFGKVEVGSHEVQMLHLSQSKSSDAHITIADPNFPGPEIHPRGGAFSLVGPMVPARVGPGDPLPFAVMFSPAEAGSFQALLTVFLGDEAVVFKLVGTA